MFLTMACDWRVLFFDFAGPGGGTSYLSHSRAESTFFFNVVAGTASFVV